MRGIVGGPGVFFRIVIAGVTSILIMSTMSLAFSIFTGAATSGVDFTGGFIGVASGDVYMFYNVVVGAVGVITFLGSFYVLSKK